MNKNKDVPKKKAESERFQLIYEKVLSWGVLLLALVHMLSALTRYIFDYFSFIVPFERWFTIFLAAAGLVYLLLTPILWRKNAKRLKIFFKKAISPLQIYCAVLFLWYILTCWVNEKEYGPGFFALNDWWLLDTFINCIILFSLPRFFFRQKIELLLHVAAIAGTVIAGYALHCLFALNVVTLPSGSQIGMQEGLLFNMGCHYNLSAAIELTMILICLYMLASQKLIVKIPYGAALIAHTYVLLVTNSRTAFVACMVSYALALFLLLWNVLSSKPLYLRWAAGIAGAAAAAGIIWLLRPMAFQYFEDVTHFSEILAAQKSKSGISVINNTASYSLPFFLQNSRQFVGGISNSLIFPAIPRNLLKKRGKRAGFALFAAVAAIFVFASVFQQHSQLPDTFSLQNSALMDESRTFVKKAFYEEGSARRYLAEDESEKVIRRLDEPLNREKVWETAVNVLKSNKTAAFFGVTPAGVSQAMKELGESRRNYAHAHNEILQMGVSMGVPMMILFAAFLIYMTVKSIRLGMITGRTLFRGACMIPIVFGGFAVATLTEAYLFGYYSIMSSVFFLFCGWINALTIGNEK